MNKKFCIKFSNILILFIIFFSSNLVGNFYQQNKIKKPKNIILFIGDGLGLAATSYVIEIEDKQLNIENFKIIGLSKTSSYSNYITDSGAGATAIATGHKTYNTAIGVNKDTFPVKNIMEIAKEEGLSTGIVVTSSVTHATPAAFVAHVRSRNSDKEIAYSYLNNTIDIFIGGGKKHFNSKILDSLIKLNYTIIYDTIELKNINNNKIVGLLADNHLPRAANRGNMLSLCVSKSIDLLSENSNGFFLLVEGSQIDWAAHLNEKDYLVNEIKDFDKAIGVALDFAKKMKIR